MIRTALSLTRADLLKLRRRRGLMVLAGLTTIGAVALIFTILAIRHGSNPLHNGPAGGIKNLENSTDFIALMGVVAAAMIGATAGAGDAEAGVLGDMVATGRSRVALFGSRAAAGVVVTLAFVVGALVVANALSVLLAGSLKAPSLSYMLRRDVAVAAFDVVFVLVAVGLATFTRSRGPVIGVVIGFGLVVSQTLLQVSFLGNLRAALPLEAFLRMAGDTTNGVSTPLATAVAVTAAWGLAALGAGAWRARRAEV